MNSNRARLWPAIFRISRTGLPLSFSIDILMPHAVIDSQKIRGSRYVRYSQGALSFFFAVCMLPLDLSVMPMLLDFPTELSTTPGGDIIEMPLCSISHAIKRSLKHTEICHAAETTDEILADFILSVITVNHRNLHAMRANFLVNSIESRRGIITGANQSCVNFGYSRVSFGRCANN